MIINKLDSISIAALLIRFRGVKTSADMTHLLICFPFSSQIPLSPNYLMRIGSFSRAALLAIPWSNLAHLEEACQPRGDSLNLSQSPSSC